MRGKGRVIRRDKMQLPVGRGSAASEGDSGHAIRDAKLRALFPRRGRKEIMTLDVRS